MRSIRQVPHLGSSGVARMIRNKLKSLTELNVIYTCFKCPKGEVQGTMSTHNVRPGESFPEELMFAVRSDSWQ